VGNVAIIFEYMGRLDEAAPLYREALDGQRRARGDAHAATLNAIDNYALFLHGRGELDAAEAFRISLVDETFQEEFWGVDEEAQKRRRLIAAEITLAERMLHLARIAA
jgi:hypothetical protein